MIVSTCNRVEVVAAGDDEHRGELTAVARATVETLSARAPEIQQHLYTHSGPDAVRHLFRVAASLDSLVLGEPQILGQVKEAFDRARAAKTLGPVLHRVVPRAIRSAKRVRTETTIGAGQVSVPSVAVELTAQIFGDLRRHTAALIGSGEMGESVLRLLRQAGARVLVVGRNAERVATLARDMGAEGRSLSALDATLVEADVFVTTTSAPHFVVDRDRVAAVRRARRGRNLFFIDLAVPRDVDPRVGEIDGVFLYNIDDLSRVVADGLKTRAREAERGEAIVAEEARGYDRWAEAEQVTPTVVALRNRLRAVLTGEVARSLEGRLRHYEAAEREVLEKMIEAFVNKVMHGPTRRLRSLAADASSRGDLEQYLGTLTDLFELSATPAEGSSDPEAAVSVDPPDAESDDFASEELERGTPRQGIR
jgi:glutamyl-tRNA reductase